MLISSVQPQVATQMSIAVGLM